MRILEIRETAVPIRSAMRNAVFDFSEMTTSVVAVITDRLRDGRRVVGFAFNATGRYACGEPMRTRFIPRLLAAAPDTLLDADGIIDPERCLAVMSKREKPGGDAERAIPIGTIETALWDAAAKARGLPLHALLARRYGPGTPGGKVFCYVGGGWYLPGQTLDDVRDEMKRHRDAGYVMIKTKVGGLPLAEDRARIAAVVEVAGAGSNVAVDANGAFDRDRAFAYAEMLAPFGLRWFEEPAPPLDFALYAEICARYPHPIGSAENLYSPQDVANLIRFGGLRPDRDILQVDPPQAYGLATFARIVAMAEAAGFSRAQIFPHGGNLMSLACVGGLGLGGCEAYPGVFGPFAGYTDEARVEDGWMRLPDLPGIGFEGQSALYAVMRELAPEAAPGA
ncbi:MAG TPA: enolase C-terminal domain-like protein [Falsiroseomonas sp.]|jgi:L-alanine-DL-glutamate epimerase-like enolase superfamily enzyme|nr:enolase C-terminal domain-like protein [Falsiroseomonas sp.]